MTAVRLMLIDDEPHVLSALQRVFRQHPPMQGQSCTVETFTSPRAAVAAAQERVVDVVVCDYRMPEQDGIETLRQFKQLQPLTGRILLSGSREFDTVVDAINVAEVARVVIKPWGEAELVSAVRDAVETRRLRMENAELADQLRVQRGLLSKQEAELRRLESLWPGITQVQFADDGSVQMSDLEVLKTNFGSLPPQA